MAELNQRREERQPTSNVTSTRGAELVYDGRKLDECTGAAALDEPRVGRRSDPAVVNRSFERDVVRRRRRNGLAEATETNGGFARS